MSEKQIRVRFAPSPTGWLHVGGARTALFNWLFARATGGKFILRIEDTDEARNTREAVEVIYKGLRWLGLDWDEGPDAGGDCGPYFQSQRKAIYEEYLEKLRAVGRVYDEENGSVRFRFHKDPVLVRDVICGDTTFTAREEPDMTVRRPDGSFIFHFVNVVDDLTMGMTHVIRGEDHLSNTWKHVQLFEAFGAEPPLYAHIPLILNENGSKMSKRDDGASLHSYQDEGFLPQAVLNYLALLGWSSKSEEEVFSREELATRFRLEDVNGSNARFDMKKCRWFSGAWMRRLSAEELLSAAEPFLAAAGLTGGDEEFRRRAVKSVAEKVETLAEIPAWIGFLFRDEISMEEGITPDPAAASALSDALATEFEGLADWDRAHIDEAVARVAAKVGLKPGKCMPVLRAAVSGSKKGPDLHEILDLLGSGRVIGRLKNAARTWSETPAV